ncbi:MAG: methyltransferase [Candidatus Woesearchaeota archaeon]
MMINSDTIYEPQEDSYLLAKEVKKYSRGNVLDMGAGSGIQGISALENKNTKKVLFVDINPNAIGYIKKYFKDNKNIKNVDNAENIKNANNVKDIKTINNIKDYFVLFKVSNLYSKISIRDKFDTIIFNPPYLPEDEFDNEKLITTGGENGSEIIEQFLIQSKNHLNIDGQILLLFSSLTDKGKVDEIIRCQGYNKNLIAKQNLFMEQLYVYQLKLINPNIIKGHRGIVEIKGNIAIKRSLTEHYNADEEAKFLKILNTKNIGPKYISHKKNELKMEYINGDRILDYLEKANKKQILTILAKILDQLYIMDTLKINKLELTNPYKHIIVRKHKPILIDFERCIYTNKPKNVTQFIQFLCSGYLKHLIHTDEVKFRLLAINYKKNMTKSNLKTIVSNLK